MREVTQRFQKFINFQPELSKIANRYFRSDQIDIVNKAGLNGFDPVTKADKEIESIFRNWVSTEFPDDSVIGEEMQNDVRDSEFQWIIDPIDGTRAFVIGAPSFTTLLALKQNGKSQFGIISQPYLEEVFIGLNDQAFLQRGSIKKAIRVSTCTQLNQARLATTFPEIGTLDERRRFLNLERHVQLTRYGLDGYGYAMLAAGHIDLIVESGLKPFDYEAPKTVIEAAGGYFGGWEGNEVSEKGQVVAAASLELFEQAIEKLNQTD